MRDESAEEMASKIEEGCTKSNMEAIVDGLEKLFGFLEAHEIGTIYCSEDWFYG